MKKLLILGLLLLKYSCSTDKNIMIVSGDIDGLKKGTIYLQKQKDSIIVSIDSMLMNGQSDFSLEAKIDEPDIYFLYLDKNDGELLNDKISFFGNIGKININTRLQTFDSGYEISGSKNN